MKEMEIGPNEAGQRLDKYLRKLLPKAESSFLYKMLRKKNIVVNGKKTDGAVRLRSGDHIILYFSDETYEKFTSHTAFHLPGQNGQKQTFSLNILYETDDILLINKPAGLLSQKAAPSDLSANELMIQYLLDSGAITQQTLQTFRPSICNRLDRNTSGILIAGKTLRGSQMVSKQLKDHSIAKYYCCIVAGEITGTHHLKGWLYKDHEKNKVQIYESRPPSAASDAHYIETEYRPIQCYSSYTMLEVHLITGRSHQIRAHLSSASHPIIGDSKYGDIRLNKRFEKEAGIHAQLLHAYRIVFPDETEVIAPLPEAFQRAEQLIQQN